MADREDERITSNATVARKRFYKGPSHSFECGGPYCLHRTRYTSRQDAHADIFDYIECFYNPTRRHSILGYVSPIAFERLAVA